MEIHLSTAYLALFCLIAISFGQGTHTGSHVNRNQLDHLKCDDPSYISSGNSCCKGKITKGLSQLVAHCCESVAYNHLNEICCKGDVFIRTSAHVECCGKDLYLPMTHLCCGGNITVRTEKDACCDGKLFDKTTSICCPAPGGSKITPKTGRCSIKQDSYQEKKGQEGPSPALTSPRCGSKPYNPMEQMCCSGNLYKASALNQCCGKEMYTPFDDHVLCCNGTLHRVPKHSECVGGVVYFPGNTTCNLSARPRLGEHCCGGKPFDPVTHICCNGHSHHKKDGNFCCGSEIYDHRKQVCCSGHRFNKRDGECCGNHLLEYKSTKICCSSSTHAVLYDTKPNHHCCGHYHYNTSLWSCCAEHLKPTPSKSSSHAGYRLKPLMDLIPDLCNKTVLFGKVESITLDTALRHIVLKVGNVGEDPWLYVSLDHCSSPALEIGMTYLWERIDKAYKPLSISFDIISDMHLLYNVCDKPKFQKGRIE